MIRNATPEVSRPDVKEVLEWFEAVMLRCNSAFTPDEGTVMPMVAPIVRDGCRIIRIGACMQKQPFADDAPIHMFMAIP